MKKHIISHTALRGIAAMLVVIYHLQYHGDERLPIELATNLFKRSYIWVDFFFLLSGFILTYVYSEERDQGFSSQEIKKFAIARFARIYPLHFVTLIYMVAFSAVTVIAADMFDLSVKPNQFAPEEIGKIFTHLTLTQSWGIHENVGWNIPSWSISTEAVAYAVFPFLLPFILHRKKLFFAGLLLMIFGFYAYIAITTKSLDITTGLALIRCLAGFCLGIFICLIRKKAHNFSTMTLSILQLISIASIIVLIDYSTNDVWLIIPFTCLVLFTTEDRGVLSSFLNNRVFIYLGERSYSIYLTHLCVLITGSFIYTRLITDREVLEPTLDRALFITLVYAGTLIISHLTYKWIEIPARRWITVTLSGKNFTKSTPV